MLVQYDALWAHCRFVAFTEPRRHHWSPTGTLYVATSVNANDVDRMARPGSNSRPNDFAMVVVSKNLYPGSGGVLYLVRTLASWLLYDILQRSHTLPDNPPNDGRQTWRTISHWYSYLTHSHVSGQNNDCFTSIPPR